MPRPCSGKVLLLLAASLVCLSWGCGCGAKKSSDPGPTQDLGVGTSDEQTSVITGGATSDNTGDIPADAIVTERDPSRPDPVGGGERVARLTPEQVSKQIKSALDIYVGLLDGEVLASDYITEYFAVSLGGLDLLANVRRRDRLTKVQTILVGRQVAWMAARNVIDREEQVPPPDDTRFTKCNFLVDHPGGDPASEARWTAQVQHFYRAIFSRQADDAEVEAIAATFETIFQRDGGTPTAWLAVLYTLIASLETWNTWR